MLVTVRLMMQPGGQDSNLLLASPSQGTSPTETNTTNASFAEINCVRAGQDNTHGICFWIKHRAGVFQLKIIQKFSHQSSDNFTCIAIYSPVIKQLCILHSHITSYFRQLTLFAFLELLQPCAYEWMGTLQH